MDSRPEIWQRTASFFSLTLGFLFALSAITHLLAPYRFFESIVAYQLIGSSFATLVAIALPAIQLSLVAGLIWIGSWRKISLLTSSILLFLLFSVQLTAYLRGLQIDCGCFGHLSHKIDAWSLAFVGGLASTSMIAWRFAHSEPVSKSENHSAGTSGLTKGGCR